MQPNNNNNNDNDIKNNNNISVAIQHFKLVPICNTFHRYSASIVIQWRWALVSPDGVAPSRMVGVSASVSLPLHHKHQKFSSGTGSTRWSLKKGVKQLWCGGGSYQNNNTSAIITSTFVNSHKAKLQRWILEW